MKTASHFSEANKYSYSKIFLKGTLFFKAFLISLAALLPLKSQALDRTPPNTFFLDNRLQTALVTLHYKNQVVEAHVINRKEFDLPNSIQISLIGESGKHFDMELTSSELGPVQRNVGFMRNYRGTLPSNFESYTGVEVKIPFYSSPNRTYYASPIQIDAE